MHGQAKAVCIAAIGNRKHPVGVRVIGETRLAVQWMEEGPTLHAVIGKPSHQRLGSFDKQYYAEWYVIA